MWLDAMWKNVLLICRYNLEDSNVNDANFDKLDKNNIPDVILVKKHYGDKTSRRRRRIWKLKHLTDEQEMPIDVDNK